MLVEENCCRLSCTVNDTPLHGLATQHPASFYIRQMHALLMSIAVFHQCDEYDLCHDGITGFNDQLYRKCGGMGWKRSHGRGTEGRAPRIDGAGLQCESKRPTEHGKKSETQG